MRILRKPRHMPLVSACFMVSLFLSCSKADPPVDSAVSAAGTAAPEAAAAKTSAGEPSAYGLNPLAILEPGNAPLWFELGAEGPLLINAPGAASLTPFEPWPLARYAAGFLFRGDDLFLAVNRDGFLIFTPRRGEGSGAVRDGLALYRAADPLFWQRYTLGAFFFYRDFPAALLYRNDFFADPAAEAPSPRVWGLVPGTPYPAALELPAFDAFPPGAGWDIDALRQGQDGRWYYRGVQNPAASPAPRYLRTADLSQPGEETSLAAFQESARPESLAEAPPLLRLVLEEAFKLSGSSRFQTAAVLFPGLSGPRRFSPDSALNFSDEDLIELSGYYRDAGTGTLPDALAILEDGRGIYGKDRGAGFEIGPFVLPPLQEGFVYTGAAPAGTALIAAWEEQQGWNVGAAGFMVLK